MQVSQLTDMLDMSGAGALKVTFHHCNSGAERSLTGRYVLFLSQLTKYVMFGLFPKDFDQNHPVRLLRIHKKHLK